MFSKEIKNFERFEKLVHNYAKDYVERERERERENSVQRKKMWKPERIKKQMKQIANNAIAKTEKQTIDFLDKIDDT